MTTPDHAARQVAKRKAEPFMREMLTEALYLKTRQRLAGAALVADAIRIHGLEHVIVPGGRHDGRAVTFAQGYELVYGERLTLRRTE